MVIKMEYYYKAIGNYEEHKSYYDVMNEYAESETLKEILLFMDEAFPEWKTNAGIGHWSVGLVSDMISFYGEDERSQREALIDLYADLSASYESNKTLYSLTFNDRLIVNFNSEYEFELDKVSHLEDKAYNEQGKMIQWKKK